MSDYTVRVVDLPYSVGGLISESSDGHTNIYINARHGLERQRQALKHELRHLANDDLHSTEDIHEIEARACGLEVTKRLPRMIRAGDLVPKPARKPKPWKKIDWKKMRSAPQPDRWDLPGDISNSDFIETHSHYDMWTGKSYRTLW